MSSKVYFVDLRARTHESNKMSKIRTLFDSAGFGEIVNEGDLTAIKLHFGERGNDGYLNPVLVRQVVDKVRERGGKPFLTDTNTLYTGSRHNAVDHIITALEHGFDYTVTQAPLIISDGLRSDNSVEVRIDRKRLEKVILARDIATADSLIALSHFKGHEMTGFGGAIKNIAMGGAPAIGKKEQHACRMTVDQDKCIGCGKCYDVCPGGAVVMEENKAKILIERCIGCGECLTVCTENAAGIDWATELRPMVERMTEYAYGVAQCHKDHIGYMNFLLNVTPDCDCTPWSDANIVPNIGILASKDPVAIDQASYDLVNQQLGVQGTKLEDNFEPGEDKFTGVWKHTDPTMQLRYGMEIGLGDREYDLIHL